MRRRSQGAVVGYSVLGTLLALWSGQQVAAARIVAGSEFQVPTVRLTLAVVTIIVAGFAFGMAVEASRSRRDDVDARAFAIACVLLLVVVAYFYATVVLHLSLPGQTRLILTVEHAWAPCAAAVGFLLARMILPRFERWPGSPGRKTD